MSMANSSDINVRHRRWVALNHVSYNELTTAEQQEYDLLKREFHGTTTVKEENNNQGGFISSLANGIKDKIKQKQQENRILSEEYKKARVKADLDNIKKKARADSKAKYKHVESGGKFFGGMGKRGLEVFGGMQFDKSGRIENSSESHGKYEDLSHRSRYEERENFMDKLNNHATGSGRDMPTLDGFNSKFDSKRKIFGF
jgi:hypothetical protein